MQSGSRSPYEVLGIPESASKAEIKNAFKRRSLATHPDKVKGKEAEFREVKIAFSVLTEEKPSNKLPHNLTHEQLLSIIFNNHYFFLHVLSGTELYPGQEISESEQNHLRQFLEGMEHNFLQWYWEEKNPGIATIYKQCLYKIDCVIAILLEGNPAKKMLYDMSLIEPNWHTQERFDLCTQERNEFAEMLGGLLPLIEYVSKYPKLYGAQAIFILKKANLLNKDTFEKLIYIDRLSQIDVCNAIVYLHNNNLINQKNIDGMIANIHENHASTSYLRYLGIPGFSFDEWLRCEYSENQELTLGMLHNHGLLNDASWKTVAKLSNNTYIHIHLFNFFEQFKNNGDLTEEKMQAFSWQGQQAVHPLCARIDEMFAHGIYLLAKEEYSRIPKYEGYLSRPKAEAAMFLALELKLSLKEFFSKPHDQQMRDQAEFNRTFKELLHSQDDIMAEHREYWAVIVKNIAVAFAAALTVVGLVVLGGYYLYSQQLLFSQTKRESLRDAIENDAMEAGVVFRANQI